jgi:hypothetical protein
MGWTEDYMDAWNATDEDTFVAKFAPDGCYADEGVRVAYEGESELRRMFAGTVAVYKNWHWEHLNGWADDQRYFVEWIFSADVHGQRYTTPGVSVGELDGQGRILENRDYWNLPNFPSFEAEGRMGVELAAYERRRAAR